MLSEAITRSSSRGGGEGLDEISLCGDIVGKGWAVMARRRGSSWHDPLPDGGAEQITGM